MTNEIKEILDEYITEIDWIVIPTIYLKKIKDYITNLQEEIKEWEYIQDIQNNRKYRKRYLEERRKEETNLYLPDYDEVYQRYYEQKEKIDKAIEYIKEKEYDMEVWLYLDLLDILRGDE